MDSTLANAPAGKPASRLLITKMELENFKSYAGIQRLGPFRDFTCVVGPNGSGKSNLMDAISFVLGVQSRDLRSSQMRDLIFRPPGADAARDATLGARASLVYAAPDDPETTTVFSRLITAKGAGEYRVDGATVTFKQYEARLADIGVLLRARNFLVFQGDVEAMARKGPKQLVAMFEDLSGSAALRDAYDAALRAKEEAEAATVHAFNRTKEHKSERRQLKEQKVRAN